MDLYKALLNKLDDFVWRVVQEMAANRYNFSDLASDLIVYMCVDLEISSQSQNLERMLMRVANGDSDPSAIGAILLWYCDHRPSSHVGAYLNTLRFRAGKIPAYHFVDLSLRDDGAYLRALGIDPFPAQAYAHSASEGYADREKDPIADSLADELIQRILEQVPELRVLDTVVEGTRLPTATSERFMQ